jgi:hypothetical protein
MELLTAKLVNFASIVMDKYILVLITHNSTNNINIPVLISFLKMLFINFEFIATSQLSWRVTFRT